MRGEKSFLSQFHMLGPLFLGPLFLGPPRMKEISPALLAGWGLPAANFPLTPAVGLDDTTPFH